NEAYQMMKEIADRTGGRSYPQPDANGNFKPLDPNQLPAIYLKETRLISKSYYHDKPFTPQLLLKEGPTEHIDPPLPELTGFVRTTPRTGPLVKLPIMTPKLGDMPWPILAYWQYGLGKGVAFTSDAHSKKDSKGVDVPAWSDKWRSDRGWPQ